MPSKARKPSAKTRAKSAKASQAKPKAAKAGAKRAAPAKSAPSKPSVKTQEPAPTREVTHRVIIQSDRQAVDEAKITDPGSTLG